MDTKVAETEYYTASDCVVIEYIAVEDSEYYKKGDIVPAKTILKWPAVLYGLIPNGYDFVTIEEKEW